MIFLVNNLKILILSCIFFLLFSCNNLDKKDNDCNGNTRREVKLLIDDKSSEINFIAISSKIDSLQNIDVIVTKKDTPRLAQEKQVYSITAKVDEVDRKPDGDIHIRLKDGDNYLICEIPNPNCAFTKNTAWKSMYQTCLDFVIANDITDKNVTISGVAFVDINHHYKRKQSKNNMELHPVLSITF